MSIYTLLNQTEYGTNIYAIDTELLLSFDNSNLDLYKLCILLYYYDDGLLIKNKADSTDPIDVDYVKNIMTADISSTITQTIANIVSTQSVKEFIGEVKNIYENEIRKDVSKISDSVPDLEQTVKEQEYKLSMVSSINDNNQITVRHRFIRMILWCIFLLILVTGSVVLYVVDIGNDNMKANILAAIGTVVMVINVIMYIMTLFGSKKIETFIEIGNQVEFNTDLAKLKDFLLLMKIKDDHVDDLNDKNKKYNNDTHINARKYMIGDYNVNLLNQQISIIKLSINLVSILIVLFALKIKISISSTIFNGIISALIGFFIIYIMLLKKDNMSRYRYNWNKRYWNPPTKNI